MKTYFILSRNAVTLICLMMMTSASVAQQNNRSKPAVVIVEPLQFQPISYSVDTVGTAEARRSVSLYPAVGDIVTEVLFQPGDWVDKGQVLIKLDARRQTTALKRAQIRLADAKRTLERLKKSFADGAVTQSGVDDAKTLVELEQVAVEEAQADLDDRQVLAPFAGYVGLTDVEPGDRISINTLITTLDDRSQLFVNFDVPELATALLDEDSQVTLQPWNERERVLQARIAELDSRIDESDRTLKVRAIVDNKRDTLRPGLSFKVTLTTQGDTYPVVPEAALSWGATGAYVWVARDGVAKKEAVSIKQRLRGSILVQGELGQADILITEGIQRLRPDQPVNFDNLANNGL